MTSSLSLRSYMDLENLSLLAAILDDASSSSSSLFTSSASSTTTSIKSRLFDAFSRTSYSIFTSIFFGFRIQDPADPRMKEMIENLYIFSDLNGAQTAALLDIYPVFRKVQRFLPIYKQAVAVGEKTSKFFMSQWMPAKRKVLAGTISPCFAISMVKAQQQEQDLGGGEEAYTDEEAAFMMGNVGLEGSDTITNTLAVFVMAMVMYPDVARKVQACVDGFTEGGSRMPTFEDMQDPRSQYIRACMKETLRWMPTGVLGVPHAVTRDDEYKGYKIPKDSTVILNIWYVSLNPSFFIWYVAVNLLTRLDKKGPSTPTQTGTQTLTPSTLTGSCTTRKAHPQPRRAQTLLTAITTPSAPAVVSVRAYTWPTTFCG